uniref:Uncharacterized protein n=1 Tax=Crocodylus porosus TaxID=8502 RepID=A0A7M4DYD3_CROPO
MSYCGGLQYYCKLGATSQAAHICYVCSLLRVSFSPFILFFVKKSPRVMFHVPVGAFITTCIICTCCL